MTALYLLLQRIPHRALLGFAASLYLVMLSLGAVERASNALPGREHFSSMYHLLFYFGLGSMLWFSLQRPTVAKVTALVFVAGAIDEIHQYSLPFRHARVSDLLIDVFAGACAAFIFCYLRKKSSAANKA